MSIIFYASGVCATFFKGSGAIYLWESFIFFMFHIDVWCKKNPKNIRRACLNKTGKSSKKRNKKQTNNHQFFFSTTYSSKKDYPFKGGDATCYGSVCDCNPSMFKWDHMPHPWWRPYALSIYPPWPWWWIWWWSLLSASSTVFCMCMCSGIGSSMGGLVGFGREEMNSKIFSATSSAYCS